MPELENKHSRNGGKRVPEDILREITAELDIMVPKIFLDAKITLLKYCVVKNARNSVCVSVTDTSSKKYFVKICPYNNLVSEIFWRKKAHENNIPTPRTIFADTSKKNIPYMFEVIEFVDGVNWDFLSYERMYEYAKRTGIWLRKIHGIPVDGFGRINDDKTWTDETWLESLEKYKGFDNQKADALELFSSDELEKLRRTTYENKWINIGNPKLIHGDINQGNLILSSSGEIVFIDPGYSIAGDPMLDLAHAATPCINSPFFKGLKEGYETEESLTDDEKYRFEMLRLFCLVTAAVNLRQRNDSQYPEFVLAAKEIIRAL